MKTWKEVTELISKQNTLIQEQNKIIEVQKRIMKNDDEIIETQSQIIASLYESNNLLEQQVDMLKNIDTVNPKMGRWIDIDSDNAICNCCNRLNLVYGTYCKHCGSRNIKPRKGTNNDKKVGTNNNH